MKKEKEKEEQEKLEKEKKDNSEYKTVEGHEEQKVQRAEAKLLSTTRHEINIKHVVTTIYSNSFFFFYSLHHLPQKIIMINRTFPILYSIDFPQGQQYK